MRTCHDIDFTIADFAADLRAATPSQAAELAIPNTRVYLDGVSEVRRRIRNFMEQRLRHEMSGLMMNQRFIRQNDPRLIIVNEIRSVAELRERLSGAMDRRMEKEERSLDRAKSLLTAYNPLNVLDKGYAIIQNQSDEVLDSVIKLETARTFRIRVKDGEATYEKGERIYGN